MPNPAKEHRHLPLVPAHTPWLPRSMFLVSQCRRGGDEASIPSQCYEIWRSWFPSSSSHPSGSGPPPTSSMKLTWQGTSIMNIYFPGRCGCEWWMMGPPQSGYANTVYIYRFVFYLHILLIKRETKETLLKCPCFVCFFWVFCWVPVRQSFWVDRCWDFRCFTKDYLFKLLLIGDSGREFLSRKSLPPTKMCFFVDVCLMYVFYVYMISIYL